jgi:hypothetical protein
MRTEFEEKDIEVSQVPRDGLGVGKVKRGVK